MSESYVQPIAGGNTIVNKASLLLNGAGSSPRNPILQGLGIDLNLRLSPSVYSFESWIGATTPAEYRLLSGWTLTSARQWALRGVVGVGQFAVPLPYTRPVRHFIRILQFTPSHSYSEERQFWVTNDPLIELYYCGSSLSWCCDAANAYSGATEGGGASLEYDPGVPPFTPDDTPDTVPESGTFVAFGIEILDTATDELLATVSVTEEGEYDSDASPTFTGVTSIVENATRDGVNGVIQILDAPFSGTPTLASDGSYTGSATLTMPSGGGLFIADDGTEYSVYFADKTGTVTSQPVQGVNGRYCNDLQLTNESAVISLDETKIVSLYVRDYVASATSPLQLPCRLMDNWRDEFDVKHFGGALYVSVFEEGLAEDQQGVYVRNAYQEDITTFTSLDIYDIDADHEYRVVFRFRSELDSEAYVDKLVRFRLQTQEMLNVQYKDDFGTDDIPTIEYNSTTGDFTWGFDATEFASKNIINAHVVVDNNIVQLPVDDTTPFPSFAQLKALTVGGEVKIRFTRLYGGTTVENAHANYRVTPSSGSYSFSKQFVRRSLLGLSLSTAPDTLVRIIEPNITSTDENVYLEVLNNKIEYTQAVFITGLGSLKLTTPLKNGSRYDITSLVERDPVTGAVTPPRALLLLQTDQTTRLYEVGRTTYKPTIRLRSPAFDGDSLTEPADDYVIPTVYVGKPTGTGTSSGRVIEITWPTTTVQGNTYTLISPPGETGETYLMYSDQAISRKQIGAKGSDDTFAYEDFMSPSSTGLFLQYRVEIDGITTGTAGTGENVQEMLVEVPNFYLEAEVPANGVIGTDELGMLYYSNALTIFRTPANLVSIELTGSQGSRTLYGTELVWQEWLDLFPTISDGDSSLTVSYTTRDPDTAVETTFGPYTLPEFGGIDLTLLSEVPNNEALWTTSRLLDTDATMPQAKIDYINKTIQFKYLDRFREWYRWGVMNPHDRQMLTFTNTPPNLEEVDISRLFREDAPYRLLPGQSVIVFMIERDGPHVTGAYKISDTFVDAAQTNILRGVF